MAGGGGTHRVLAEQCMHKRHPGGVMGDKREGGRRELGQLQIVSPGGAHLDLHEAHLMRVAIRCNEGGNQAERFLISMKPT